MRWWQILLVPLALLYVGGLKLYLWWRLNRQERVGALVISVGNLSMGGTGKTPVVVAISQYLQQAGFRVAVLSRGYRGSWSQRGGIVSDGERTFATCAEAGDEPILIARRLPGVAVLVGKDRRRTARLAIEQLNCNAIVLDDGFQYWQLHRDIDLVLLDPKRPFANGWTLPAGYLREPPDHLHRADALLIQADEISAELERFASLPCFTWNKLPCTVRALHQPEPLPLQWMQAKRVFLVAGIARFESFHHSVEQLGAHIVGSWRLPDHHFYTPADVVEIQRRAQQCGAEIILTTEKDAVKLEEMPPMQLQTPFYVLTIQAQFSEGFWRWLRAYIRHRERLSALPHATAERT